VGHLDPIVFRLSLSEKTPPKSFCEPNPNETQWNWVIVARGTDRLFQATKAFVEEAGGKVVYQKLSGYRFRVEELRPPEVDEEVAAK